MKLLSSAYDSPSASFTYKPVTKWRDTEANGKFPTLPAANDPRRPRLPNLLNTGTAVGSYRRSFRFYVNLVATFGGLHSPTAIGTEFQGLLVSRNYPKAESQEDAK